MGVWGTGLYNDDKAIEIRDTIKRLIKAPLDNQSLLDKILQIYPPKEDLASIVWLVTADQFHHFGIEHDKALREARAIIQNGVDDNLMASLEMTPGDRAKRQKALRKLMEKWALKRTKTRNRKFAQKSITNPFRDGQIWAFPTEGGNPAAVFHDIKQSPSEFSPDGWSAFLIVKTGYQLGYFPIAYIARLAIQQVSPPSFDACTVSEIVGRVSDISGHSEPWACTGWVEVAAHMPDLLGAHHCGTVSIDWQAVRKYLPHTEVDDLGTLMTMYNVLNIFIYSEPMELDGVMHPADEARSYGVSLSQLTK